VRKLSYIKQKKYILFKITNYKPLNNISSAKYKVTNRVENEQKIYLHFV